MALGAAATVVGSVAGFAVSVPSSSASSLQAAGTTSATTCPTVAYTIATIDCSGTTTSTATAQCPDDPTLQLGYSAGGTVTWRAFDYPTSAIGTTVVLVINGTAVGSGVVNNLCDPPGTVTTKCLNVGAYHAVVVDQGFPDTNTVTFSVTSPPTCAHAVGPTVLTGSGNDIGAGGNGTGAGGNAAGGAHATPGAPGASGALAFTGANLVRLLLIALAVIGAGTAITRSARRRRLG